MGISAGKYAAEVAAGRVFIGSTTAAGTTLPEFNGTAQKFGLWNPVGSNKLAVLLHIHMALTSASVGQHTDAFALSVLHNVGAQVASGGPISAFTATASQNAYLGHGQASAMRFTLSATTTAPAFLKSLGFGHIQSTAYLGNYDFDGTVIVPPGVYIGTGKSQTDSETYQISLVWAEFEL